MMQLSFMSRRIRVPLVLAVAIVTGCGGGPGRLNAVPSPPPGLKAVNHGGVQIFVPSKWPRNSLRCGTPMEATVVVDPGPIPTCLVLNPPLVSYAWIRTSEDLNVDPAAAMATEPVSITGHAARRGEDQLPDGRTRVVLVVPSQTLAGSRRSRGVLVVAVSRYVSLVHQIIDSAYIA